VNKRAEEKGVPLGVQKDPYPKRAIGITILLLISPDHKADKPENSAKKKIVLWVKDCTPNKGVPAWGGRDGGGRKREPGGRRAVCGGDAKHGANQKKRRTKNTKQENRLIGSGKER